MLTGLCDVCSGDDHVTKIVSVKGSKGGTYIEDKFSIMSNELVSELSLAQQRAVFELLKEKLATRSEDEDDEDDDADETLLTSCRHERGRAGAGAAARRRREA